ncbi:hypothetical protein DPMN_133696 [Dreissena polymorpha]|uniref:Uncharacterized protein n=1 Tax=Dreissena polymorpha TaxID=45954 RepID=A0A9D4FYE4_DREPO|nr:hypothetical protein DPMN_133696 [Dreissena polymorpha]
MWALRATGCGRRSILQQPMNLSQRTDGVELLWRKRYPYTSLHQPRFPGQNPRRLSQQPLTQSLDTQTKVSKMMRL